MPGITHVSDLADHRDLSFCALKPRSIHSPEEFRLPWDRTLHTAADISRHFHPSSLWLIPDNTLNVYWSGRNFSICSCNWNLIWFVGMKISPAFNMKRMIFFFNIYKAENCCNSFFIFFNSSNAKTAGGSNPEFVRQIDSPRCREVFWSVPVKIGFHLPELRAVENCTCSKYFNTDNAELGAGRSSLCHCCGWGLAKFAEAWDVGGPQGL